MKTKPCKPCVGCGTKTTVVHPILDAHCCRKCWRTAPFQMIGHSEFMPFDQKDAMTIYVENLLLCLRFTTREVVRPGRGRRGWKRNPDDVVQNYDKVYLCRHVKELVREAVA